jgi:endonuclease/exonuclease/phosphatase family metal-dependent hydrolase
MKIRRTAIPIPLLLAALAWVVAGCGSSGTTTPVEDVAPGGPFAQLAVSTDSTLEVVTWNLETFPYPTPADQGHDPQVTVDLVVQAMYGLNADIYAVQEIQSQRRFDEVVAKLDGWSGLRSDDDSYNLAYVYRDDGSLENIAFTEILNASEYGRPFPRRPFLMTFTFGGYDVAVLNNHYKCCGDDVIDESDPWDETTRRRDASLILEEYIDANLAGRMVVVVGDFNDELDDPVAGNVFANFLAKPARWRFLDLPIALDRNALWSYPGWPSHLDHILVTNQLFPAAEKQDALIRVVPLHTVLSGGWGTYSSDISDHLPVEVRLDLD